MNKSRNVLLVIHSTRPFWPPPICNYSGYAYGPVLCSLMRSAAKVSAKSCSSPNSFPCKGRPSLQTPLLSALRPHTFKLLSAPRYLLYDKYNNVSLTQQYLLKLLYLAVMWSGTVGLRARPVSDQISVFLLVLHAVVSVLVLVLQAWFCYVLQVLVL